jgi:hypothetical protein
MLLKRTVNSSLGEGETWDGGEEVGVGKPTMDEAGGKGMAAAAASQDADDRTGGVDAVTDTGVSIGAGVDEVDTFSLSQNTGAVTARDDDVSVARGPATGV